MTLYTLDCLQEIHVKIYSTKETHCQYIDPIKLRKVTSFLNYFNKHSHESTQPAF
jgi:hypothetical protein